MLDVQGLSSHQMIRTRVADGDRGTAQTIPYAKQLISEGIVDPGIRMLAVQYCAGVPANDELAEMRAVFDGVLRDFRFIKDPVGTQLLQPASGVLQTHAGNCATLNLVLLPSLLGSIGYPTRAVTVKADMDRPQEFSHVYVEAQTSDGDWIPLDVARSNPVFGKEPEYYWARKNWPLTSGASAGAAFLNGFGGRPRMNRGMGASQVVVMRRRGFPRSGLSSFFTRAVPVPLPASGGPIRCGMGQGTDIPDDTSGINYAYSDLGIDPGPAPIFDATDPLLNSDITVSPTPTPVSTAGTWQPATGGSAAAPGTNYGALVTAITPAVLGGTAQILTAATQPQVVAVPVASSGSSILPFLLLLGLGAVAYLATKKN